MDGIAAATHPFLVLATNRQGLGLRCLHGFARGGTILVHCRGIEVGRLALPGPVEPGATLHIPVTRLPRVSLPAELRISAAIDGPDLAPPWRLETAAAALALLGPPAPVADELRLDQGMLRGIAVERANGLLEPVLYARINDAAARAVAVEAPVALAEGGCAFRFALPLLPEDLGETGLSITLHLIGQEAPLARFAWTRAGAGETERRLAELEGRLRRLEQAASAGLAQAQEELRRRLDIQQERIDAFVEAAASLLLDRVTQADPPVDPGEAAKAALRGLIAAASPEAPEEAPRRIGSQVEIPPTAGQFGFGWHTPERDAGGEFRWLADRGQVVNPEPDRRLAGVTLETCHLYGAAEPALRAAFDDLLCRVTVTPAGPYRHQVRITPPEGTAPCRTLLLEALSSGSPARDGVSADARLLSMAVSRLVFDYAD